MKHNKQLSRQRVRDIFNNIFKYPLTIITAPKGYGKTTEIKNFLNHSKTSYIWLSVTQSDVNELNFCKKVLYKLQLLFPSIKEESLKMMSPIDYYLIKRIMLTLLNTHEKIPFIIVIDDYHIIESNIKLNSCISELIRDHIPNLHFIISTRTKPTFKNVPKKSCFLIDNNDLAFTEKEIKEYFDLSNQNISDNEVTKIYSYTKGWISAIYLICETHKNNNECLFNSDIHTYIRNNLCNNIDEKTKSTLLSLTIFDQFSINQAVEILGDYHVDYTVQTLMKNNQFISYDCQNDTYQLQSIFLSFLRNIVRKNHIDQSEILLRAGKWFFDKNDLSFAFEFYYASGRILELLELINTKHINISTININLIKKIYLSLPKNTCVAIPFVYLQFAFKFLISKEKQSENEAINIIFILQNYYSFSSNEPEDYKNSILGEIEILMAFLGFNDIGKMIEHFNRASELLPKNKSQVFFDQNQLLSGIPCLLYTYFTKEGQFKITLDHIVKGMPAACFNNFLYGCEFLALAEYSLETGDFENALFYAQKSIKKAETKQQYEMIFCSLFVLARVALFSTGFKNAIAIIKSAESLLQTQCNVFYVETHRIYAILLDLSKGYIYSCLKIKEKIPLWLLKKDSFLINSPFHTFSFIGLVHSKIVLLSENWSEVERCCEELKQNYNIYKNRIGIIHNTIILSIAKSKKVDIYHGVCELLPILKSCQSDNIITPFAEYAEYIKPLLEYIIKHSLGNTCFVKKVLELCNFYFNNICFTINNINTLKDIELDILICLADGLTQKEISARLKMSVSTIKRYNENIYLKLGVTNKLNAIKKAQELKLI